MDKVTTAWARVTRQKQLAEEQAAIAACPHLRIQVVDQDEVWDAEGTMVVGLSELLHCPDCPLGDEWVPAGTATRMLDLADLGERPPL